MHFPFLWFLYRNFVPLFRQDNLRAFNLDSRIINFNMLRVSDAIHRRALRGVLSILITEHGNAFLLSEQQLFALRSRQEINGLWPHILIECENYRTTASHGKRYQHHAIYNCQIILNMMRHLIYIEAATSFKSLSVSQLYSNCVNT